MGQAEVGQRMRDGAGGAPELSDLCGRGGRGASERQPGDRSTGAYGARRGDGGESYNGETAIRGRGGDGNGHSVLRRDHRHKRGDLPIELRRFSGGTNEGGAQGDQRIYRRE